MARGKGKWATQSTVDLGSIMQSLMYYGQISQRQEASDEAWQDKVTARLTDRNSAWYISPNEYDPVIIEDKLNDLKAQHENYQTNHKDKYNPGEHGFDSVQETINDYQLQLEKAEKFTLETGKLRLLNDKSTEMRPKVMTDEFGNPLYETIPVGEEGFGLTRVDEDGNPIEITEMTNDWEELTSLIFNTESDEYGRVEFSEEVNDLRDNILARNVAIGSGLSEYQTEYKDWLNITGDKLMSERSTLVSNMYNLMNEERMNLERIDDDFHGDFILDKGGFEHFKVAVDTDNWDDYNTIKATRLQDRFNEKKNLEASANKLRTEYNKFYAYIHPEGRLTLSESGPLEDGTPRWDVSIRGGKDDLPVKTPMTKKQLRNMYITDYQFAASQIALIENQVIEGWGPQRSSVLLGNDRRLLLSPDKKIRDANLKKFLKTEKTFVPKVDTEVDKKVDETFYTKPLVPEEEIKDISLGTTEMQNKIVKINELKQQIDDFTWKPREFKRISSIENILGKGTAVNGKFSSDDLLRLKTVYDDDVKTHSELSNSISKIKDSGLAVSTRESFFATPKLTDVGKKINSLRKELVTIRKKWGFGAGQKLPGVLSREYSQGGAYGELMLQFHEYDMLRGHHNIALKEYNELKQAAQEASK